MPEANNWNDKIITEFRANGGRVGGNFEGAPVTLVHPSWPHERARVHHPDDVPA